jgi:hypothetical protein
VFCSSVQTDTDAAGVGRRAHHGVKLLERRDSCTRRCPRSEVSLREPGTSRRSGYTPAGQVTGRGGIAGTGRRPDGLLGDEDEDERGVLEVMATGRRGGRRAGSLR